ncbi:MAG: hypothetical protein JWN30_563 [Bacilli bacterium]|nr:hypothetical protein [Bacilli bacterium]
MGVKFVGVSKNEQGDITHVLTNHGDLIEVSEAKEMALNGEVDSITDLHPDGTWEIAHSAGNYQYEEGNLSTLPEV